MKLALIKAILFIVAVGLFSGIVVGSIGITPPYNFILSAITGVFAGLFAFRWIKPYLK